MPAGQAISYVEAAIRLKQALELNENDATFARGVDADGNVHEIVYIFDTSVFIFFAYIKDHNRLTSEIDALIGAHPTRGESKSSLDETVSRAMERLTADFIFSGGLPGQKRTGYMSVPHLDETLNKARNIGDTLHHEQLMEGQPIAADHSKLEKIQEILNDDKRELHQKISDLSTIAPKAWLETLKASKKFAKAMREAFIQQPPLVMPLDKCEAGRKAALHTYDEIGAWEPSLQAADRPEKNIKRDAETLATIVKLYRNDPKASGSKPSRRYLFITTDEAITDAVRTNKTLKALGIKNFVRSPRDYLPILNLTSMRQALAPAPIQNALRREFRAVFDTLKSALDWIVTGDRASAPDSLSVRMLSSLQAYWRDIAKYVTTINAYHFSDEHQKVFVDLAAFVTRPETAIEAARLVQRAVIDVRNEHLAMTVTWAIAAIKAARSNEKTQVQRRAQVKLIGPLFGSMLEPGFSIRLLLDDAVETGKLRAHTLRELEAHPETREAQLLAACLFVASEQWTTASEFAARAYVLSPPPVPGGRSRETCEARYLNALCLRFAMTGSGHFKLARRYLRSNLAEYGKDSAMRLSRLRDEIELGTLLITAAIMQEISIEQCRKREPKPEEQTETVGRESDVLTLIEGANSGNMFAEGAESLLASVESLARVQSQQPADADEKELIQDLSYQLSANLLAIFIFERIAPALERVKYAVSDASNLLAFMSDWMRAQESAKKKIRTTAYVYHAVATSLTVKRLEDRVDALQGLKQFLGKLRLSRTAMPLGDVLEFTFIRDWVDEQLKEIEAVSGAEATAVR